VRKARQPYHHHGALSYEINTSAIKEVPPLFLAKYYYFNLKISKLQTSHYRNLSTVRLGNGSGSLGVHEAQFRNQCISPFPASCYRKKKPHLVAYAHGNVYFALDLCFLGYANNLMPSRSETTLLWRFNVAGNSKSNLDFHVLCPTILSDIFNFGIRHTFVKVLDIKFDRNTSNASSNDTYGQTDGHEEGNGATHYYAGVRKR